MVLEESEELVGDLPEPARRYLKKVLMYPVISTVRLTDHQRKHITEVHTAFNRFIMVQVPEFPRAISGLPGRGTVIILMSFTKQHIET